MMIAPRMIGRASRRKPEIRSRMTHEVMYQLAALLPPHMRGFYADEAEKSDTYLEFIRE